MYQSSEKARVPLAPRQPPHGASLSGRRGPSLHLVQKALDQQALSFKICVSGERTQAEVMELFGEVGLFNILARKYR